jgi:phosphoribosylformylglycinamidine cyclo-ligase
MWPRPEMFNWLQKNGNVAEAEMHRVFNCGIGMVICVARDQVAPALVLLKSQGELAYQIGFVEAGNPGEPEAIVL